jgi:hypothetical protein
VILELPAGEHYYHFMLINGGSVARVPFKGELIINIEDMNKDDIDSKPLILDRFTNDPRSELFKALVIVLIITAAMYFSFYRKYKQLRKKKE